MKNMKNICHCGTDPQSPVKAAILFLCLLLTFSSCSDLLDTDSNRVLDTDKNTLQSANDSLYSMMGIWAQLTSLSERYVLLGELRGELMDVTANADADLRAIADFDYTQSEKNKYITQREYYMVINNCNYFLQHADTARRSGFESTLKREWMAIKNYRAWIYMQLALNYGEAIWLEQPLLTVEEVDKAAQQPSISRDEIFNKLIADLEPYRLWELENNYPAYSDELTVFASRYYFRTSYLLGDLYLWTGEYEKAAQSYHTLIRHLRVTPFSMRLYTQNGFVNGSESATKKSFASYWTMYYSDPFSYQNLTFFLCPSGTESLKTMTEFQASNPASYKLAPSQAAMDTWLTSTTQLFCDNPSGSLPPYPIHYYGGDSRGEQRLSSSFGSYSYLSQNNNSYPVILKYGAQGDNGSYSSSLPVVNLLRISTLYLRYAEALNNLGKPATAFAVLKYGVDDLANPQRNRVEEITPLPAYCDFSWVDNSYMQNDIIVGIHSYGSGDLEYDTIYYQLPDSEILQAMPEAARNDSLRRFVEEKLLDEYAMETAFEGNRFHDLMRFALRNRDNAILADRVAKRNPSLRPLLMDEKNWYIPNL
jgi:hypothetical protein